MFKKSNLSKDFTAVTNKVACVVRTVCIALRVASNTHLCHCCTYFYTSRVTSYHHLHALSYRTLQIHSIYNCFYFQSFNFL